MSDYGDDGDYYDEDEWIYMEESVTEADELAEHTCASPAWMDGTGALDTSDYDPFDYWQDLTYLSDGGFFDNDATNEVFTRKRKRDAAVETSNGRSKRVRRGMEASEMRAVADGRNKRKREHSPATVVVWRSEEERFNDHDCAPIVREGQGKRIALMKDWRERFKDEKGLLQGKNIDQGKENIPPQARDTISRDGFDLGDISSIAEMLSQENMESLEAILRDKGLDPDAVKMVVQDLVEGREPEFDADDEEGDGVDEDD